MRPVKALGYGLEDLGTRWILLDLGVGSSDCEKGKSSRPIALYWST